MSGASCEGSRAGARHHTGAALAGSAAVGTRPFTPNVALRSGEAAGAAAACHSMRGRAGAASRGAGGRATGGGRQQRRQQWAHHGLCVQGVPAAPCSQHTLGFQPLRRGAEGGAGSGTGYERPRVAAAAAARPRRWDASMRPLSRALCPVWICPRGSEAPVQPALGPRSGGECSRVRLFPRRARGTRIPADLAPGEREEVGLRTGRA